MEETDMAASANPNSSKCAFCIRWDGDAQLTNQGTGKGFIRFNDTARGNCVAKQNQIMKRANEGSGCKDYRISPEASRYI